MGEIGLVAVSATAITTLRRCRSGTASPEEAPFCVAWVMMPDATGVTAQTLSQIQLLPATDSDNDSQHPQLNWDATNHWAQVGTAGKFPLLRYGDNPHTSGANECEFLPDYDHVNDMNCITGGTICCGEELPNQELYRASGNLTFSNTTIGTPTTSSTPEFFYNVSDYNRHCHL